MKTFLKRFVGSDRGASMVEYGLLVALIALITIPGVAIAENQIQVVFDDMVGSLAAEDDGAGDESPAPEDDDDTPAPGDDDDDTPAPGGDDDDDTPAPGGDDDDDPAAADPGSEAVVGSTGSSFFWWNSTKNGGEGAWKATVNFTNDHNRHQYLTLEVTRTNDKGKTTTSTVSGFYVPANGSSTYELWDNDLKINKAKTTGIVSVEVKVVSVTTSDQNWQPVTYPQYGNSTVIDAPTP